MAYTNISARLMTMAPVEDVESGATQEDDVVVGYKSRNMVRSDGDHIAKQPRGNGSSNVPANYRRRASAQVETSTTTMTTSRYQKNPAVRNKRYGSSSSQKKLSDAIDPSSSGGGGGSSVSGITVAHSAEAESMLSVAPDPSSSSLTAVMTAEAASIRSEQLERRRASSKASAIFLVSATSKDAQLVPEDEDDGSPEGRRRRRTISIIATVGAFLLVLSILLVTVTLRLASHIDDIGKQSIDSIHFFTAITIRARRLASIPNAFQVERIRSLESDRCV